MNRYKNISSVKLLMMRNTSNAKKIDAELDRRNVIKTPAKRRRTRRPKYRMIDYEYEIEAAKYC